MIHRVTAIMAWRNYLQVQPINKTDYVYAAGIIGLPNFLELWLGIIVACLPTLTPLYSRYLKPAYSTMRGNSYQTESDSGGRGSGGRKDVKRTFGSYVPRGHRKPKYDYWDEVSYLDMEEGKYYSSSSGDYKESLYPTAPAPIVPKGPSGAQRLQKSLPETPKLRYEDTFDTSRAIQVRSDVTVFSEPGKW